MEKSDTLLLLEECNAGTKMAVASFDEVLDKVESAKLKEILAESKNKHEELGNELHELLCRHHADDKDPSPIAKGFSWFKTNMQMAMDFSDKTIASLMTDGADMGVKSLQTFLNEYQHAGLEACSICKRLIQLEEELRQDLQPYL